MAAKTASPIVVTHETGLRFAAMVRDHRVITDQPAHVGGADTAPSPIELLSVALGSCVALYVEKFCEPRRLSLDGMQVEVVPHMAASPPSRLERFEVRVVPPTGFPERYLNALERAVRTCPAYNTLSTGAGVSFVVGPVSSERTLVLC